MSCRQYKDYRITQMNKKSLLFKFNIFRFAFSYCQWRQYADKFLGHLLTAWKLSNIILKLITGILIKAYLLIHLNWIKRFNRIGIASVMLCMLLEDNADKRFCCIYFWLMPIHHKSLLSKRWPSIFFIILCIQFTTNKLTQTSFQTNEFRFPMYVLMRASR